MLWGDRVCWPVSNQLSLPVMASQTERVKPASHWREEKDPEGRSFWRSDELKLSCWEKPGTDEILLANMTTWVEMVNPDGRRYVKNTVDGEVRRLWRWWQAGILLQW